MGELLGNLPWFKKIELLRVAKGWTQDEAAKKCFTNQKSYWNWENGKTYPRLSSRILIASAFGVEQNEIFERQ